MSNVVQVDSAFIQVRADTVRLYEEDFPVACKLFQSYLKQDPDFIEAIRRLVYSSLRGSRLKECDIENELSNKLMQAFFDKDNKPRPRVERIAALDSLCERVRRGLRREKAKSERFFRVPVEKLTSPYIHESDTLLVVCIDKEISSLPPRQRKALSLAIEEELTNAEIAEIMELTESRVSQLLTEARARIKKRIHFLE